MPRLKNPHPKKYTENTRSYSWMFTLNNPTQQEMDLPRKWKGSYCIYQLEKGLNLETPHLQGYIHFENAKYFSTMKKLSPRCHWEPREGTHKQARDYCSKIESRVEGPWSYGIEPHQGQRTDLLTLQKDLDLGFSLPIIANYHFQEYLKYPKAIETYIAMRQKPRMFKSVVTVIYGPTGTGKSRSLYETFPQAYWVSRPAGKGTLWFNGYTNQETVIFDEFYGWVKFDLLLRLCDRYPIKVEIKGSVVEFRPLRIFFTSNKHPTQWYKNIPEIEYAPFLRRVDVIFNKDTSSSYILEKCGSETLMIRSEGANLPVRMADQFSDILNKDKNLPKEIITPIISEELDETQKEIILQEEKKEDIFAEFF